MNRLKLAAAATALACSAGTADAAIGLYVQEIMVRDDGAIFLDLSTLPYDKARCSTNDAWDLVVPVTAPSDLRNLVLDLTFDGRSVARVVGTGSCSGNVETLQSINFQSLN